MIDLENQTLTVRGKTEPLQCWDTWFVTLEGTFDAWSEAVESANRMNQTIQTIIPIPVALSENLYEPFLNQGVYVEQPRRELTDQMPFIEDPNEDVYTIEDGESID